MYIDYCGVLLLYTIGGNTVTKIMWAPTRLPLHKDCAQNPVSFSELWRTPCKAFWEIACCLTKYTVSHKHHEVDRLCMTSNSICAVSRSNLLRGGYNGITTSVCKWEPICEMTLKMMLECTQIYSSFERGLCLSESILPSCSVWTPAWWSS